MIPMERRPPNFRAAWVADGRRDVAAAGSHRGLASTEFPTDLWSDEPRTAKMPVGALGEIRPPVRNPRCFYYLIRTRYRLAILGRE
jgi:hypothetical protein